MIRKAPEPEKENAERWLLTYADLITLLLIFFIVLYSMSSVDAQKYTEMSQSLAIIFGQTGRSGVLDGGETVFEQPSTHHNRQSLQNARSNLQKMIIKAGMDGKIVTEMQERGLVISIRDTVLFFTGSARLSYKAYPVMAELGRILSDLPNTFRIEGHTDNDPIYTSQFESNWELSTARATNVVKFFINNSNIPPAKLSATGYGEFRPVVSNKTETGKALNRRVDVVVVSEQFEKIEPQSSNLNSH